jgi:hypothetical protein
LAITRRDRSEEAPVAAQRGVARPAAWPHEHILDSPLQHIVGWKADGIRHASLLKALVEGGAGKGCVGADGDALSPGPVPVNGEEDLVPRSGTVYVARPELGGEAVAVLVEDEQRMLAEGREVAVTSQLLLRAVDRTLRAVESRMTREVAGLAASCWTKSVLRRASP